VFGETAVRCVVFPNKKNFVGKCGSAYQVDPFRRTQAGFAARRTNVPSCLREKIYMDEQDLSEEWKGEVTGERASCPFVVFSFSNGRPAPYGAFKHFPRRGYLIQPRATPWVSDKKNLNPNGVASSFGRWAAVPSAIRFWLHSWSGSLRGRRFSGKRRGRFRFPRFEKQIVGKLGIEADV
jgi:hypothetical protein